MRASSGPLHPDHAVLPLKVMIADGVGLGVSVALGPLTVIPLQPLRGIGRFSMRDP